MRPILLIALAAFLLPRPASAWRQVISGTYPDSSDVVVATAVDASGDVVAAGVYESAATRRDWFVAKFAGGTGAELWRRVFGLSSSPYGVLGAKDVAFDASGDVIVTGYLGDSGSLQLTVVKL